MKRICPTIQELLTFDAVARHESMTLAANILCMSVSAVSKQLATLESFIGKPLLAKQGRGIKLTPTGKAYWQKVGPALRTLESATVEALARNTETGVITLASVPTFLTKWLIPRLPDFRRQHPGVTFSFNHHLGPTDSQPPETDAAIRYGTGDWPNVSSDYIAGRDFVCVYAPQLVKTGTTPQIEQIDAYPLLHHEEAPQAWRAWAMRYSLSKQQTLSGPRFVQYSALIQAALCGLGVGLVPRILVEDELQNGFLRTLGEALEVDQGHYLCFHPDRLDTPAFVAFRDWLLAQTRPSQDNANSTSDKKAVGKQAAATL